MKISRCGPGNEGVADGAERGPGGERDVEIGEGKGLGRGVGLSGTTGCSLSLWPQRCLLSDLQHGAMPDGRAPRGVCGADAETIAGRNLLRMIAAGAAAHSDHGRDVVHTLLGTSQDGDYSVKDPVKLRRVAHSLGVEAAGKDERTLAREVAERALAEFGRQEGELRLALRAPERRVERWRKLGIMPRGIDREITDIMHRTTMGVDADFRNLIFQGLRCALADG